MSDWKPSIPWQLMPGATNGTGVYIIRGHGGTPNKGFVLGRDQFVIFPTTCGMPSSMRTTTHNKVLKLLSNPANVYKFMRGNINRSKYPPEIRNLRVIGPGSEVVNSYIEMKNNTRFPLDPARNAGHRWYHTVTGVHKVNRNGRTRYLSGRGDTKHISNIIGNQPGFYYIDACRVLPGVTQNEANRMLRAVLTGKRPVGIQNSNLVRLVKASEANIIKKASKKRPRLSENLSLKRNTTNRPLKRTRSS